MEVEIIELEEQSGFRAGRSCIDNAFCLSQLTEKSLAHNREAHLIFIDLKKAYDSVPIQKLCEVLESSNISPIYTNAIKQLYASLYDFPLWKKSTFRPRTLIVFLTPQHFVYIFLKTPLAAARFQFAHINIYDYILFKSLDMVGLVPICTMSFCFNSSTRVYNATGFFWRYISYIASRTAIFCPSGKSSVFGFERLIHLSTVGRLSLSFLWKFDQLYVVQYLALRKIFLSRHLAASKFPLFAFQLQSNSTVLTITFAIENSKQNVFYQHTP